MDLSPGRRRLPLRFLAGCTVTADKDVAVFGKGVPAASCSPSGKFFAAVGSRLRQLSLALAILVNSAGASRCAYEWLFQALRSPCLSLECLANLPLRTGGVGCPFCGISFFLRVLLLPLPSLPSGLNWEACSSQALKAPHFRMIRRAVCAPEINSAASSWVPSALWTISRYLMPAS